MKKQYSEYELALNKAILHWMGLPDNLNIYEDMNLIFAVKDKMLAQENDVLCFKVYQDRWGISVEFLKQEGIDDEAWTNEANENEFTKAFARAVGSYLEDKHNYKI